MDISYILNKKPEEIVNLFKKKGYRFSWDWWETWQEAHARAFTVAKAMKLDILQDIREMVQKALEEGIPFSQFKKELEPGLKAKGWWGRSFEIDEEGKIRKVYLGTPWRLKTIFQTNLQSAYMSGRYKSLMENADNRPYWQYIAVLDARTRPSHRILHGKVFRFDDPFWDSHFPPNGFNCRCRVRALSEKELNVRNLSVESSRGKLKEIDQIVSKRNGLIQKAVKYTDSTTGKSITPDPGWNYNPGKAAFFPDLDKYDYDVAVQWVKGGLSGQDFKAFLKKKIKGYYPVAVLNPEYKNLIGAKSQTIYLSTETLEKQLKHHPELSFNEYTKIPLIISKGQTIIRDSEHTIIFIKHENRLYHAVVKTTVSGNTLFLISFRRARKDDVKKEILRLKRKKGVKILLDEL